MFFIPIVVQDSFVHCLSCSRFVLAFDAQWGVPYLHMLSSCHPYTPQTAENDKNKNQKSGGLCPGGPSAGAPSQQMASWGSIMIITAVNILFVRMRRE